MVKITLWKNFVVSTNSSSATMLKCIYISAIGNQCIYVTHVNMQVIIYTVERFPVKRDLNSFSKSIDSRQPAQSAQANMGRNLSQVIIYIVERFSVKRDLNSFSKSIDSRQPAQSAKADMGRNLSLSLFFLNVNGPFHIVIWSVM